MKSKKENQFNAGSACVRRLVVLLDLFRRRPKGRGEIAEVVLQSRDFEIQAESALREAKRGFEIARQIGRRKYDRPELEMQSPLRPRIASLSASVSEDYRDLKFQTLTLRSVWRPLLPLFFEHNTEASRYEGGAKL